MTKTDLTRGNEIISIIEGLKAATIMLNNNNFFNIATGNNSRYDADSFLAQLHLQVKEFGFSEISKKILELEAEFDSL